MSPSSDDLTHEREALEDLIRSDGWRLFVQHVGQEWKGAGYYARMNSVLTGPSPAEAMVVHRCSAEIISVLMWPDRRVTELTEPKA